MKKSKDPRRRSQHPRSDRSPSELPPDEAAMQNGEMTASNEELQSINEDLTTVNQELKSKVDELGHANSDLQNLMASTNIPTVFLDRQLHIKRYTPSAIALFQLIPTDLGRPLSDLSHRLEYASITDDAVRVLETLQPVEREARSSNDQWYLVRLQPYRTIEDRIDGVVITFVDITERKAGEAALAAEKEYAESIVQTLHEPLLVLRPDLTVHSVNEAFYTHFRVNPRETIGRKVYDLGNGQWNIPALRNLLEDVLPDSHVFNDHEVTHDFEQLGRRVMLVNGRRLAQVQLILLGIRDITDQKRAELEGGHVRWDRLTPPEWMPRTKQAIEQYQLTGRIEPYEKEYFRRNGERFWGLFSGRRLEATGEGVAIVLDVTERKWAEAALRESEERLQLAIEIGELASWDWDMRTGLVQWNDRHYLMQGYAVGEVTPSYEAWLARIHPDDREAAGARTAAARENREAYVHEFRIQHPDGTVRWCSARGRFFYDAQGEPYRMIGVMEDVSESKRDEYQKEALLRLNDVLRTPRVDEEIQSLAMHLLGETLGAASVSYWEVDGDHYVVDVSFPGDQPSIKGRYPIASFGEGTLKQYRLGQTVVENDIPNGERLPEEKMAFAAMSVASYIGVPILSNGELLGGLGVSSSTVRTWRPDEIALAEAFAVRTRDGVMRSRAERALKKADKKKDEFLAMLAHELRNPLAPIRNGVELLRMEEGGAEAKAELLSMLDRQLTHMVRLVDDLMDVNRISRGKLRLQPRPTPIGDVVQESVEACRSAIQAAGHSFTVKADGPLPVLNVDRARMVQVINNLLTNAAKYTEYGGHITLRAFPEREWLVITVADDGIGIAAEHQAGLFDLFSQVEGTQRHAQGGLGIGLNLVKRLVKLHDGQVSLHSEGPGRGSIFTVRLPLREVPLVETKAHTVVKPSAVRRVLIVDDNVDAALTLSILLKKAGYTTFTAHNGQDGIDAVHKHDPHIVILDIGLPDMDGYSVARAIAVLTPDHTPVLIALTGYGQEEDVRRARMAGFKHHLTKPVRPEELRELLAGQEIKD